MSLYEIQLQLEVEMQSAGTARFREEITQARQAGRESTTPAGVRLVHETVIPLSQALQGFLDDASTGKPGRHHAAIKYLRDLDTEVAAYVTARAVIDGLARRTQLTKVALEVGNMIEDEFRFRAYDRDLPGLYRTLIQDLRSRTANYVYQRRLLINRLNKAGATFEAWSKKDKLVIGVKLIDLLISATGLVETMHVREGRNNRAIYLRASEDVMKWIGQHNTRCEMLSPIYLPMVVPPRNWDSPFRGGYLTPALRRLKMIKTANRDYLNDLAAVEMPQVYDALNTIQSVPWRINRKLFDVLQTVWRRGGEIGGLPKREDFPIPPKVGFPAYVKPENMTDDQKEALTRWKVEASRIHQANHILQSKRIATSKQLWVAEKYLDFDAIYFPHVMDWRGRIYPAPLFLNPQSNDSGKALLEFSKGKPLGEQGACWLAIHGANMFGEDKVALQDRVSWAERRSEQIVACADDPFNNRWWTEADEPYQFLAFCFEWAGFVREGFDYVSHLPVGMDGSCNGLQNFAAMLRDEKGGEAVNLLPADEPNDIYQRVADNVIRRLSRSWPVLDSTEDAYLASEWLKFGVDRTVVKRPVMTLPYGATQFGFRQQVMDDTLIPAKMEDPDNFPFEGDGWAAAKFLAGLIWQAVSEEIVAARVAMDWLQEVARGAAEAKQPIHWTSPFGLPVVQEYRNSKVVRVATSINQQRVRLKLRESTKSLDKRRQTNGIAPNFVHSCDASHLMRTALLFRENVPDMAFGAVHDSFSTHACDAEMLGVCLRLAFTQQYEKDVLSEFKERLVLQLPDEQAEKITDPPPAGNLDLSKVMEADFFFA